MSRYIERAENTARLADVNIQLLLEFDHDDEEMTCAHWRAVLESWGDDSLFDEFYDRSDTPSATEFLTFSRNNPSSVLSCVLAARENARMIRDQISAEMWEIINRLYLFLKKQDAQRVLRSGPADFFQEVKEASHLFHGMTDATFPRKVGYEFLRAGCYLERADKTARILDLMHHFSGAKLEGESIDNPDAETTVQWKAVLRCCTALEAYHRVYVGEVLAKHVLEFLVFSREFPRSIMFCLGQLQLAIHAISKCPISHYSNEAERVIGRIVSDLVYSSLGEVIKGGIHERLTAVREAVNTIAIEFSDRYMFCPIVDPTGEDAPMHEVSSQSQSQSQVSVS